MTLPSSLDPGMQRKMPLVQCIGTAQRSAECSLGQNQEEVIIVTSIDICWSLYILNVIYYYTPGIYADGYIVFAFPFVRSSVRMFVSSFVLPSRSWNLRQSFASKFLIWCISQQVLIRKHSYLDHSYPGGLAFTP